MVVAASTKSEHVEKSTLKKQHKGVFKTLNGEAEKNNDKPVRPFVFYDLTRFGRGWENPAAMSGRWLESLGSNIRQSSRYVHPSDDAVLGAMERIDRRERSDS